MKLEELGITKDELIERIISKVVDDLNDRVDGEDGVYTRTMDHLREKIDGMVGGAVSKMTQTTVADAVDEIIEAPWPKTNSWGEPRGDPLTFREMVAIKMDKYLTENVNKKNGGDNTYDGSCPRIDYLIRSQVAASIDVQIKAAIADASAKARDEVMGKMNEAVIAAVKNVMGIK